MSTGYVHLYQDEKHIKTEILDTRLKLSEYRNLRKIPLTTLFICHDSTVKPEAEDEIYLYDIVSDKWIINTTDTLANQDQTENIPSGNASEIEENESLEDDGESINNDSDYSYNQKGRIFSEKTFTLRSDKPSDSK